MKKHAWLLSSLLSVCQFIQAQDLFTYLAEDSPASLYGFADSAGYTKTAGRYNLIMRPSEGICRVWAGQRSKDDYSNIKYGYCLTNGAVLVTPQYNKGEDFSEGLALVSTKDQESHYQYGFINRMGLVQIPLKYYFARSFSQGVAPVTEDMEEWYYIDKSGLTKIAGPFLSAEVFSEGLAAVSLSDDTGQGAKSSKKGYIDLTGKVIIKPEYNSATSFKNGFAIVSLSRSTPEGVKDFEMLIDRTGKRISKEYISVRTANANGLFAVKLNSSEKDSWAVMDTKGTVYAGRFNSSPYFSEDLAPFIREDGLYGYKDKNGTVVIKPAYKDVAYFAEGMAAVAIAKDQWGYINKKGEIIIKPAYVSAGRFSEGVAIVCTGRNLTDPDKFYGAIDKTGKTILPFEKRKMQQFKDGKVLAEKDGFQYYLYKNGETTLACDPASLKNAREIIAASYRSDAEGIAGFLRKEEGKNCPAINYWLGYVYLQAAPPQKDSIRGAKLMEQSALGGYPDAMYSIGFVYLNGLGGKTDLAAARQWFSKAAKAGVTAAFTMLGTMDDEDDPAEAAKQYQSAADLGEPTAMYNLAMLYKEGRGVQKSFVGFWNWLERSAQKNYEPAKAMKQEMKKTK